MLDERLKAVWTFAKAVRSGKSIERNLNFLHHIAVNDSCITAQKAAQKQLSNLAAKAQRSESIGKN